MKATSPSGVEAAKQTLTLPEGVILDVEIVDLAQIVQTEIGQLEDEPRIDDAVGALEVAVQPELGVVNESHSFNDIVNERVAEIPI